jgi:YbgC/YbaW family acyl-CoA thioester hydrolase
MYRKFSCEVMINESHLDSFGHVNNAVYLELYEQARWEFITENGYGLDRIQSSQQGPVVLDLQVKFKREIKNREKIIIESQTVQVLNSKIMILEQKMINSDGKVASEASFTVGFFDLKERKLIEAPKAWLQAVGIES